jgi:CRISPR-associated protein Cmr4
MITATKMLYLYVETPLHAGIGSGLSSIDLPIQRERTTQYPMIQGSGIKGKLRSAAYAATEGEQASWSKDEVNIVFGPEREGSEHAGALIAGDARILLFPVRSLNGVFAYTTSYDVLNRFMRDVNRRNGSIRWKLPEGKHPEQTAYVTQNRESRVTANNMVVLEEFSFTAASNPIVDEVAAWIAGNALSQTSEYTYWRNKVLDSLVILPENDFRDFALYATEVITRVRIDRDKKTVERGALWTEEHLPTDTLLYVPVYATNSRKNGNTMQAKDILDKATSLEDSQRGYIQLGGDETVGRGLVRMHWEERNATNNKEKL